MSYLGTQAESEEEEPWRAAVTALGKDLAPFDAVLRRRFQSQAEMLFLEGSEEVSPWMMEAIRCDSDEKLEAVKSFDLRLAFSANDIKAVVSHGYNSALEAIHIMRDLTPTEEVSNLALAAHHLMVSEIEGCANRLAKAVKTTSAMLVKDLQLANLTGEEPVEYKPLIIALHEEINEVLAIAFMARLRFLASWLVFEEKANQAEILGRQIESYESQLDKQNNPFGLPFGRTDFNSRIIEELAAKNGYQGGKRNLLARLAKWKEGERESGEEHLLSRAETEAFLQDLLGRKRKKPNCTLTAQSKNGVRQ